MRFRAVLVAIIGFVLLAPDAHAVGPNLLPNASFEDGLNKTSAPGVDQPLLPIGWAFEGAAGLFDHTPSSFKTGRYSAAISIPASGKQRVCVGTEQTGQPVPCQRLDPVTGAKDTAATAYSVNPAWRPLQAVPVRAGTRYLVGGWLQWSYVTLDEGGADVRVRWLNANGVPIKTDIAYTRVAKTMRESENYGWASFEGSVVAPAGATQAIPLFGAADDVWNSNVKYDDVRFQAA